MVLNVAVLIHDDMPVAMRTRRHRLRAASVSPTVLSVMAGLGGSATRTHPARRSATMSACATTQQDG
jgi:hypothetical protein